MFSESVSLIYPKRLDRKFWKEVMNQGIKFVTNFHFFKPLLNENFVEQTDFFPKIPFFILLQQVATELHISFVHLSVVSNT